MNFTCLIKYTSSISRNGLLSLTLAHAHARTHTPGSKEGGATEQMIPRTDDTKH